MNYYTKDYELQMNSLLVKKSLPYVKIVRIFMHFDRHICKKIYLASTKSTYGGLGGGGWVDVRLMGMKANSTIKLRLT